MAVRLKQVSARRRSEAGFSLIQVIVAIAVIGIVSGFAVVRMAVARDQMSLTSAAREFAGLTEKSRLDSIRRHAEGGAATITISSASSYQVLLDFNYTGTPITRTYTLPDGVTFSNVEVTQADGTVVGGATLPLSFSFDWRGRSGGGSAYRITLTNTRAHTSVVGITAAGEVSLDRNSITLLAGAYGAASGDLVSIGPGSSGGVSGSGGTTTVEGEGGGTDDGDGGGGSTGDDGGSAGDDGGSTGDDGGSTGDDGGSTGDDGGSTGDDGGSTGGGNGDSSAGGNTTGGTGQCTMTVSPSRLDLHNSGNNTPKNGTFTVTFNNPPSTGVTVTASESGDHLTISVSSTSASVKTVNVASKNGSTNRGNFDVVITPTNSVCGSAQTMQVSVAN